jgi:hypothetical protein
MKLKKNKEKSTTACPRQSEQPQPQHNQGCTQIALGLRPLGPAGTNCDTNKKKIIFGKNN